MPEFPVENIDLFYGGPVGPDTLHFVHKYGEMIEGSLHLKDDIYWSGNFEQIKLLLETGAVGMAVDTLSLDYGQSADFATHYAWLPTNRWGIENLANLDAVPAKGATLVVGAPKHRGGSGGPARVFAMV